MIIQIADRDAEIVNGAVGPGDYLRAAKVEFIQYGVEEFVRVFFDDGQSFLARFTKE